MKLTFIKGGLDRYKAPKPKPALLSGLPPPSFPELEASWVRSGAQPWLIAQLRAGVLEVHGFPHLTLVRESA